MRHPLFHASGADIQTVHRIMVALRGCDDAETTARAETTAEPLPASWRGARCDANACRECGAAVVLHARDGDVVCASCGVVSHEVVFGVGYAGNDEPQCGAAERKGVHALVVAPSPYDYTERLEHWNHYTRLPKSRCQRAALPAQSSHQKDVRVPGVRRGGQLGEGGEVPLSVEDVSERIRIRMPLWVREERCRRACSFRCGATRAAP